MQARLGQARIHVQIDVGFGDAITPAATDLEFPTLLTNMPSPNVLAYPTETIVSEKVEAMVDLGISNSRMKDFTDVAMAARRLKFSGGPLVAALRATFRRRGTALPEQIVGLSERFVEDANALAGELESIRETNQPTFSLWPKSWPNFDSSFRNHLITRARNERSARLGVQADPGPDHVRAHIAVTDMDTRNRGSHLRSLINGRQKTPPFRPVGVESLPGRVPPSQPPSRADGRGRRAVKDDDRNAARPRFRSRRRHVRGHLGSRAKSRVPALNLLPSATAGTGAASVFLGTRARPVESDQHRSFHAPFAADVPRNN